MLHAFSESKIDDWTISDCEKLIENLPLGIILVGDRNIQYCNDAFTKYIGYGKSDLIGKALLDFIDPSDRERLEQECCKSTQGSETRLHTYTLLNSDRSILFNADILSRKIAITGKEYNILVLRDVTRQKQYQDEQAAIMRMLGERVKELNCIYGLSDVMEETGLSFDEKLTGIAYLIPSAWEYPELVATRITFEDKEYKTANFRDTNNKYSINIKVMGEVLGKVEVYYVEEKPEGNPKINFKEPNRLLHAIVERLSSIIEHKRAEEERRKFEKKIQQAQKLESMGILASGVANDFNNMLTGIIGNADFALMEVEEGSKIAGNIENILEAAERAAELAGQMLAYSGKDDFNASVVSLNSIIDENNSLLETSISKKIKFEYVFSPNLPPVEIDVAKSKQVMINLINNSATAIGDKKGQIKITTGSLICDDEYLEETVIYDDPPEGEYVFMEITDDGIGMDKKTISQIFDPFFTTYEGNHGLGLAAVLGIMRIHKGAIKVSSEVGKGTTFTVLFPTSNRKAEKKAKTSPELANIEGNGETILVADDEESVRIVVQMILEKMGYNVILARDGKEAVVVYENKKDMIDLVILDRSMPELSGEEVIRKIHKANRNVPVIISSGHPKAEIDEYFEGEDVAAFVLKPYRTRDLLVKVREVLDKILG